MQVSIFGNKLAECLMDEGICYDRYRRGVGGMIFRRLAQLAAAPTLESMRNLGRCRDAGREALASRFRLDLGEGHALVFEADGDAKEYLNGKSVDWSKIKKITVVDIEQNNED